MYRGGFPGRPFEGPEFEGRVFGWRNFPEVDGVVLGALDVGVCGGPEEADEFEGKNLDLNDSTAGFNGRCQHGRAVIRLQAYKEDLLEALA